MVVSPRLARTVLWVAVSRDAPVFGANEVLLSARRSSEVAVTRWGPGAGGVLGLLAVRSPAPGLVTGRSQRCEPVSLVTIQGQRASGQRGSFGWR